MNKPSREAQERLLGTILAWMHLAHHQLESILQPDQYHHHLLLDWQQQQPATMSRYQVWNERPHSICYIGKLASYSSSICRGICSKALSLSSSSRCFAQGACLVLMHMQRD